MHKKMSVEQESGDQGCCGHRHPCAKHSDGIFAAEAKAKQLSPKDAAEQRVNEHVRAANEAAEEYNRFSQIEAEVIATKEVRVALDEQLQKIKILSTTQANSTAKIRLKETIMWLGMHLKELGTPNPYPNSYNTGNSVVDPTADGMKL